MIDLNTVIVLKQLVGDEPTAALEIECVYFFSIFLWNIHIEYLHIWMKV